MSLTRLSAGLDKDGSSLWGSGSSQGTKSCTINIRLLQRSTVDCTAQHSNCDGLTTSPRWASLCASWNQRLTASCTTAVRGAVGTGRAASGCGFTRGVATLAADRAVPFTVPTAATKFTERHVSLDK